MATQNNKVTTTLDHTRNTKNWAVVENDADDAIIRNIYIKPEALSLQPGDSVKVTLEVVRAK